MDGTRSYWKIHLHQQKRRLVLWCSSMGNRNIRYLLTHFVLHEIIFILNQNYHVEIFDEWTRVGDKSRKPFHRSLPLWQYFQWLYPGVSPLQSEERNKTDATRNLHRRIVFVDVEVLVRKSRRSPYFSADRRSPQRRKEENLFRFPKTQPCLCVSTQQRIMKTELLEIHLYLCYFII